jgi:predicted metalloprotease with PDZ domain
MPVLGSIAPVALLLPGDDLSPFSAKRDRTIMQHDVSQQRVARGWVGLLARNLPKDPQKWLGYDSTKGALIGGVVHDGPAHDAGVRDGDIVVEFAKRPVSDARQLGDSIAAMRPAAETTLVVFRSGRKKRLRIVIGQFDTAEAVAQTSRSSAEPATASAGPACELPSEQPSRIGDSPPPTQPSSHAAA